MVHTDVCGPMSVASFSGCRYFVSFVDEYTGYIFIVPIARKSDVLKQFKLYLAWVERTFSCAVKRVQSDHGGEFIALKDYLSLKGIEHTMSLPYSPNLNGMAERVNRTIVEWARTMLEHASLPKIFWAEAVVHAARVRNVLFCPRDRSLSSLQLMSGRKPDVSYFRVFGCLAWYHLPKEKRTKLDAKSIKGIIIGYLQNKQYKVWLPERSIAVVSRDVTIVEDQFPGSVLTQEWDESPHEIVTDTEGKPGPERNAIPISQRDSTVPNRYVPHRSTPLVPHSGQSYSVKDVEITDEIREKLTHYPPSASPPELPDTGQDVENVNHGSGEVSPPTAEPRYPRREHRSPAYFKPTSAKLTRALATMTDRPKVPSTIKEAFVQHDAADWRAAVNSELESLRQHETWEIVNEPPGVKTLSTRFVFIRKYDDSGNVIRHKARLVMRGYLQGDVEQNFAPVLDFTTIRTCLTVAIQRGYEIQQMDVRTPFLHGEIDSDVYMKPPDGLQVCGRGQLLKLRRGLYGLTQAPRLWQDKWKSVMQKMKFVMLMSDECVFRRGSTWILLYVDDIILVGAKCAELIAVKRELKHYLDVKDLGALGSFLGVSFVRERERALLSQKHYILQVLQRFGMSECKAVSTPMAEGALKAFSVSNGEHADQQTNQELLGCLLFVSTRTRPDISAAVAILCRYASKPNNAHWVALKRVLRYLQGTKDFSLLISASGEQQISASCDADWAGDREDRRSTTGFLLQLDDTTVAWRSIKQTTVALSTTEAEFVALSEGAKLIVWMRCLLKEMDSEQAKPTMVREDNQGALVWEDEGVRHAKHISIRKNFVREQVENQIIRLVYCPTAEMCADILTKPLPRQTFELHRQSLAITNSTPSH